MRMFLLSSDEDTVTGMRLAGIEGMVVKSRDELLAEAERAEKDPDIGILLVTNTVGQLYADSIVEIKKKSKILVTQLPDMLNPTAAGRSITRYVRNAIGAKGD